MCQSNLHEAVTIFTCIRLSFPFGTRPGHWLSWGCSWFYLVLLGKCQDNTPLGHYCRYTPFPNLLFTYVCYNFSALFTCPEPVTSHGDIYVVDDMPDTEPIPVIRLKIRLTPHRFRISFPVTCKGVVVAADGDRFCPWSNCLLFWKR